MLDLDKISKDYYKIMYNEYLTIKKFIKTNQNILSIGAGIGGLEVIINNSFENENFTFIERDFVSKKIRYGWDDENNNGDYDEEKLQYRPIDWSLLNSEIGQSHLDHYSKLIFFRKSNPALYRGQFHDLYRYSNEKVIVYGYEDQSEENNNDEVVVIANFSTMDQIITNIPFLSNGQWYDIFGDYAINVTENSAYDYFEIPKKTAIIFSNRQWNLNIDNHNNVPEDFSYFNCYPNPFNDQLTIKFFASEVKEAKINIYDLNGKKIYANEIKTISSGENFLKWNAMTNDGLKLSSSVYIVSITYGTEVLNQKILFLK